MADELAIAPENSTPPPSFTVFGDQRGILGDSKFNLGDTVTAQLKVTSVSDDTNGPSVGFEVVSVAPGVGAAEPDGDEAPEVPAEPSEEDLEDVEAGTDEAGGSEPDEEESILGYKRPKAKKQAPKLSAKDLQDY